MGRMAHELSSTTLGREVTVLSTKVLSTHRHKTSPSDVESVNEIISTTPHKTLDSISSTQAPTATENKTPGLSSDVAPKSTQTAMNKIPNDKTLTSSKHITIAASQPKSAKLTGEKALSGPNDENRFHSDWIIACVSISCIVVLLGALMGFVLKRFQRKLKDR